VKLLGENSREINDIVTVITNVAYQTHRLALDAAVQAAMAGDNGKGFAAVASDIRRLAEQTKNQTGMIARVVRSVNVNIENVAASMQDTEKKTEEGTRVARQAGRALESIFDAVERQAGEIESIHKMATEQLHSSGSIVQTTQSLSKTTLESSDSTRAASQNMWRLSQLVEQLRASVEVFKLGEEQQQSYRGSGTVDAQRHGNMNVRRNPVSNPPGNYFPGEAQRTLANQQQKSGTQYHLAEVQSPGADGRQRNRPYRGQ
jgi:ATP-dependent 26S proteasome regulatory subunit